MPSGAAAGLTVLGTLTILIGLLTFVGSQFIDQFDDIKTQVGEGYDQIRTWIMDTFRINATVLDEWIEKARQQGASALSDTWPGTAAGVTAGHAIAGFFIAMFTLFFFLHDGARIWPGSCASSGRGPQEGALLGHRRVGSAQRLHAGDRARRRGRRDRDRPGRCRAGVPFASGVAILVFFGAFIPVIGAAISGAVPVLLALVALGPVKALIMLAGVIAVQQIESHLLQPLSSAAPSGSTAVGHPRHRGRCRARRHRRCPDRRAHGGGAQRGWPSPARPTHPTHGRFAARCRGPPKRPGARMQQQQKP